MAVAVARRQYIAYQCRHRLAMNGRTAYFPLVATISTASCVGHGSARRQSGLLLVAAREPNVVTAVWGVPQHADGVAGGGRFEAPPWQLSSRHDGTGKLEATLNIAPLAGPDHSCKSEPLLGRWHRHGLAAADVVVGEPHRGTRLCDPLHADCDVQGDRHPVLSGIPPRGAPLLVQVLYVHQHILFASRTL